MVLRGSVEGCVRDLCGSLTHFQYESNAEQQIDVKVEKMKFSTSRTKMTGG